MAHGQLHHDTEDGADALFYPRAVLADLTDFDDQTILDACTTIFDHADAPADLRAEAAEIWSMIIGGAP
ncbi:hypothetical protein ATO8_09151 [Roseivivax marinus]|jgi:hypothetical protein|uniref:Uncharacterized protein n=1 Tax=Roseivivax marinus TaxID=1379903 RepID=W4HLV9_9RHOB|nr:hypothetical protein [Roseivivax marinus]ETW13368.1 hypothetical protein ATO8_09151 [Roseivivax marinus]